VNLSGERVPGRRLQSCHCGAPPLLNVRARPVPGGIHSPSWSVGTIEGIELDSVGLELHVRGLACAPRMARPVYGVYKAPTRRSATTRFFPGRHGSIKREVAAYPVCQPAGLGHDPGRPSFAKRDPTAIGQPASCTSSRAPGVPAPSTSGLARNASLAILQRMAVFDPDREQR